MKSSLTRRELLTTAAVVPGAIALSRLSIPAVAAPAVKAAGTGSAESFTFPFLGDLHFDRLNHHDMEWLAKEHPGDVRQVENYTRISTDIQPRLFGEVRGLVTEFNATPASRVPFVLHAGDFVEGLCGSRELSTKQNQEAIQFARDAKLGAPFLFCKGNHDVTGPGAREDFDGTILPFLGGELERVPQPKPQAAPTRGYFAFEHGNSMFAIFDAYDEANSLDWLEATLKARTAQHLFVLIHPPVVPYGARANWHIFAKPKQAEKRARLLKILGDQHAFVLGGHIHKYNSIARRTETGRFVQLAVSSVIPRLTDKPGNVLEGVASYTPDQIKVEPNFNPDSEAERRAILTEEAPFVEHFEYADSAGYAVINVRGDRVEAQIYNGLDRSLWKTLDLSALLNKPKTV